jgi:hypothetical protein
VTGDPYVTAQDVIDCCDWPAFGQASATAQTRLIAAATRDVDTYCRRPFGFWQQTVTEVFSGRNNARLFLRLRPVSGVAAIVLNGTALDDTTGDAWAFDPWTGRLVRGRGQDDTRFVPYWPSGEQNIQVTYYGGYQELPDDLVVATAFQVRYLREQGRVPGVFSSESLGGWGGTLNAAALTQAVPPHVAARLAGYVIEDAFA